VLLQSILRARRPTLVSSTGPHSQMHFTTRIMSGLNRHKLSNNLSLLSMARARAHTHTHIHTHTHTHSHTHTHTHTLTHSHSHTLTHTHTHTHALTHTHSHSHSLTLTLTLTLTHTHSHSHTHTLTHKQTNKQKIACSSPQDWTVFLLPVLSGAHNIHAWSFSTLLENKVGLSTRLIS